METKYNLSVNELIEMISVIGNVQRNERFLYSEERNKQVAGAHYFHQINLQDYLTKVPEEIRDRLPINVEGLKKKSFEVLLKEGIISN